MTTPTTKLHKNIHAAIVEALQLTGIASVTATYSGSGDSGDNFEINATNAEGAVIDPLPDVTILYMDETTVWDPAEKLHRTVNKQKSSNLESAVEDACWAAVATSGHDGWEKSAGGSGQYAVTMEGTAALDHSDNYESDGDSKEYELEPTEALFSEALKRIAEVLTANQAASVRIEYSGEGDSGSVSDISIEGETELDAHQVVLTDYPLTKSTWVDGEWKLITKLQSMSLASALEDLMWDAISRFGHDGFDNNEGGYGDMTINADGTGKVSHTDNIETSETNNYVLLSPEDAEVVA